MLFALFLVSCAVDGNNGEFIMNNDEIMVKSISNGIYEFSDFDGKLITDEEIIASLSDMSSYLELNTGDILSIEDNDRGTNPETCGHSSWSAYSITSQGSHTHFLK